MSDKAYTVTVQWPVRYDFQPGAVGRFSPCRLARKVPHDKAWEKIERLLRKAIEK